MYGKWEGFEPKNGLKLYSGSWNFDLKVGKWINYDERGRIESLITYNKKGELHGRQVLMNENNIKMSDGNFKNGKRDGKWEYYYDFGGLWRVCSYQEGKLNGHSITYSEDGAIEEDANYKDNKYHGVCTFYDKKTRQLVEKGIFENGKMVKFLEGTPGASRKKS